MISPLVLLFLILGSFFPSVLNIIPAWTLFPVPSEVAAASAALPCIATPSTTPATTASTPGLIIADTSADLLEKLKNAKGGETIFLRPKVSYGGLVRNINPAKEVRITSLDPQNRAIVTGLDLRSVDNLTLDNIHFEFKGVPTKYQIDIRVSSSTNIAFLNSTFKGLATAYVPADGTGAQNLMNVRTSANVRFENNSVSNFMHGIGISRTSNISIKNNDISYFQGDGMDFSQVNNVVIENNYFHDFFGSDSSVNHNDFIQFWTTNTTAPSTNIVIRKNRLISSTSFTKTQGIFFRDQLGDLGGREMRYQNVRIEDNTIDTDSSHGITMPSVDGLIIARNSLVFNGGVKTKVAININKSTKVEVYDNIAPHFNIPTTTPLSRFTGNTATQPTIHDRTKLK